MASVLFKSIRQISTYIRKCFRILKKLWSIQILNKQINSKWFLPFAGTGSDLSPFEWWHIWESIVSVTLARSHSALVDTVTVVDAISVVVIGQVAAEDSLTVSLIHNLVVWFFGKFNYGSNCIHQFQQILTKIIGLKRAKFNWIQQNPTESDRIRVE